MQEPAQRIDDLILENFTHSRDMLLAIFGLERPAQLAPFQKILAAMRALPPAAQTEIAQPLIEKFAAELGADPKTDKGQATIAAFVDVIALGIQDATAMIMQNMQSQAVAANALRQGQGNLLRG